MPVWEARRLFPDAVYLPADFRYYGLISGRMFGILRRYSPEVEASSIDEGFVDMNGIRSLWRKGFRAIADDMRRAVKREIGITVSVGVSVTKTLAKMASESHKPDGTTVISGRRIEPFLAGLDVRDIPGIGSNRAALLRKFDLRTALDFVCAPPALVRRLLGKAGEDLWHELKGTPVFPMELTRELPKSVARTASLGELSGDRKLLAAHLARHTSRLAAELVAKGLLARRLRVFLRLRSFECVSCEYPLDYPTSNYFTLHTVAEKGLSELYSKGEVYRGCGVIAGRISRGYRSEDLFGVMRRDARQARLALAMAGINRRYGRDTIRIFSSVRIRQTTPGNSPRFQYPLLRV
jgi:DNA polymerase-4/DNA polymerase V